ncbi:hypothetical protein [Streptomyces termitum]|uniref:hypothetical protein n=1 Tax=Streptomyces termitum TaxID=67368 RepID=UPI0037953E2A
MSERTDSRRPRAAFRRGVVLLAAGAALAAALPAVSAAAPASAGRSPAVRTAAAAEPEPAGAPVSSVAPDGTVTLFARAGDGTVHRRVRDRADGRWSAWTDTRGAVVGDPVTALNLDKRPSVFVRRADGRLWYQKQAVDGAWAAWADLGAPPGTTVAGAPVVVAGDNTFDTAAPNGDGVIAGNTDGRLELFVRGTDARLWHRAQKAPNGTAWSAWEALPGTWAGGPAAAVGGDGRITVFGRKADGRLKVTAQKKRGTSQKPLPADNWSPWKEIGTGFTGNVTVAAADGGAGILFQVFGNRSDGRLWTLAQSAPGTRAKPAGVWAEGRPLGPKVPGRPVVARHTDGRLAVFGIDTGDRVVYRTQSSPAGKDDPNGVWLAGWQPLDGTKARAVTVVSAPREGSPAFDVFAVAKGSDTLYQRTRLAAGSFDGSRKDVWLDWTDIAPIGSGACGGPGSLDCLTVTNSGLNLALGLERALDPESYVTRGLGAGLPWQKWALRPTDDTGGAVALVNVRHGTCLDDDGSAVFPFHLKLAPCDPARASQQWTFEPVMPADADKERTVPTDFRIRQRAGWHHCLTALAEDVFPHVAERVELIACDTDSDNDHNTWKLGNNGGTPPDVLRVVLDQAARWCARYPEQKGCVFVPVGESSAYQAVQGCVAGRVLYNQSPDRDATYTLGWTATTGTEFTFGGSLGFEGEGLAVGFNASMTWLQQDSVTEQAQIPVPPKQFGWIELGPVMRETAGYWKIRLGGTWTVPGRNVSYAKDGTDGVGTFISTRTSKTPPSNGHCG